MDDAVVAVQGDPNQRHGTADHAEYLRGWDEATHEVAEGLERERVKETQNGEEPEVRLAQLTNGWE